MVGGYNPKANTRGQTKQLDEATRSRKNAQRVEELRDEGRERGREATSCCCVAYLKKEEENHVVVDGEKNLVGVMGSVLHSPINEQYLTPLY